MIVIVAEKPDVGSKIAAALDKITLDSGKMITFEGLESNEKIIKAQQNKDGYLKIKYMGQECYVTWGRGHLCELKGVRDYEPTYVSWGKIPLPYIPAEYEIQLRTVGDETLDRLVKKQFAVVSKLINKATLVVNATDFDREGEVIFSYIYELAKCKKPVKRACFSSQTKEGIRNAFDDLRPGADFAKIDAAGRMRGIADWLVGINLTIAMSLKNPGQGVTSIGRVQTPTLAIVVKRELEIQKFKPEPYWSIGAVFQVGAEQYKAKHRTEKIADSKEAAAIMAKIDGKHGVVSDVTKKSVTKEPPHLYSLSALQMEANSKLGLTLKQTLEIVQKLYDKGYVTYPRTNSQYLTEDMEPTINKVLDKLSGLSEYAPLIAGRLRKYDRRHYFDDSKVESHFAIIPTDNIPKGLTGKDAKVYDMICRSVIRMLYGSAKLEQTKILTVVAGEEFVSSGNVIVEPGWMAVGDSAKEDILPAVKVGDELPGTYTLSEKKTKPPTRYNDKDLLAAMLSAGKTIDDADLRKILSDPKTGGIGTEATRAAIVETLVKREYIKREAKAIAATEKGIRLIENLPLEAVKSAEMTARWEKRLNDIARGIEDPDHFRKDIEGALPAWIAEVNSKVATMAMAGKGTNTLGIDCPVCGKPMTINKWGYGCSGWRDGCKFGIGVICGKKLTENQARILVTKKKTPLIKGFTSKAGKSFDAYLVLDGKDIKFEFPPR